jgi:hypothetical protein
MVKRTKRLEKGVESLKQEIEIHFSKLKSDIEKGNIERGRYHIKELDKSLIFAFENKLKILNLKNDLAIEFRERLEKLRDKFEN